MTRATQRGMSLVELLIGLAIGLFVVTAALTMLVGSLQEQRALTAETRVLQDLQTSANLIARELRRSAYWGDSAAGVWRSEADQVAANPYVALSPAAGQSNTVSFRHSRDDSENGIVDDNEQFGFRLRSGVIESLLGGSWQALTDSGTLVVSEFSVRPSVQETRLDRYCTAACTSNYGACPPRLQTRSMSISLTGHAVGDASVVRTTQLSVRLRNDAIVGSCAS